MNKEAASSTLASVLEEVEKATNTPIDKMLKRKNRAAKGYARYSNMVIAALVFTMLSPLIFVFTSRSGAQYESADISVEDYYVQGDMLWIDLDGPFIDYTSIYAVSASGSTVFPVEYNSGTGMVSFIYDGLEWNIYVSDLNKVPVHMLLTPP